ncbi:hypothetical protein FRB91_004587 [Serendipita sp. 411]|nr:hypothetical protein FRB91_004587 [Serendipita sp. 411]
MMTRAVTEKGSDSFALRLTPINIFSQTQSDFRSMSTSRSQNSCQSLPWIFSARRPSTKNRHSAHRTAKEAARKKQYLKSV